MWIYSERRTEHAKDIRSKQYLHAKLTDKNYKKPSNSTNVSYYKAPYIGNLLTEIKQKIIKHCKCTNIKIVFSPFKVVDLFIIKESVPKYLSLPKIFRCLHIYVSGL